MKGYRSDLLPNGKKRFISAYQRKKRWEQLSLLTLCTPIYVHTKKRMERKMEVNLKGKIAKGGIGTKKDPKINWYSVMCPGADNSTDVVMLLTPNVYANGQEISIRGEGRLEFVRESVVEVASEKGGAKK